MNNLNELQINKLNSIYNLSRDIYNEYQKLYELEISGKKNTQEYIEVCDNISFFTIVESRYYNYVIENNYQNCNLLKGFINYINKNFESQLVDVFNIDDIYCVRMYYKLIYYTLKNNMKLDKNDHQEVVELKYNIALNDYIIGYFLDNLSNTTDDEFCTKYARDIVKLRYDLSYVNTSLENMYLETRFNNFNPELLNLSIIENTNDVVNYTRFRGIKRLCMDYVIPIMLYDIQSINNNKKLLFYSYYIRAIGKVVDKLIPDQKDELIQYLDDFYKDSFKYRDNYALLMTIESWLYGNDLDINSENKKSL